MADLISRAVAVKALGERPMVWNDKWNEYELGRQNQFDEDYTAIMNVPSEGDILVDLTMLEEERNYWQETAHSYERTLAKLQKAIPEERHGKWIGRGDDACECSECHAVIEGDEVYWRNNYFCYHCGARMDKGDGE